jgi:hypothetical protein
MKFFEVLESAAQLVFFAKDLAEVLLIAELLSAQKLHEVIIRNSFSQLCELPLSMLALFG